LRREADNPRPDVRDAHRDRFEVNPSPAFSYFERDAGQPIARAIALALAGES
jgi:hypothetical protein